MVIDPGAGTSRLSLDRETRGEIYLIRVPYPLGVPDIDICRPEVAFPRASLDDRKKFTARKILGSAPGIDPDHSVLHRR